MISLKKSLFSYILATQYYPVAKELDFKERFVICSNIADRFQMNLFARLIPVVAIPLFSAAFLADNPAVSWPCFLGGFALLMIWYVAYSLLNTMRHTVFLYLVELTRRDMMLASIRASWMNISQTEEGKQEIDDYYQAIIDKVHGFCGEQLDKNVDYR